MMITSGSGPAPDDKPKIPDTVNIPLECVLLKVADISVKGEHPKITFLRPNGRESLIITMGESNVDDPLWSSVKVGDRILVPISDSEDNQTYLHFCYAQKWTEGE